MMKYHKAFSLMELLVVMAIIVILASLSVPAFEQMVKGSRVTIAGRAVLDELNLAQQTALSRNLPVEVRFFKLPDTPGSSTPTEFRALQTFINDGTDKPLSKLIYFPPGVVLEPSTTKSTILLDPGPLTNATPQAGTLEIPDYGTHYSYLSFRFRGNGETDLNATVNGAPIQTFLTLIPKNEKKMANDLPANFVTIQIDPGQRASARVSAVVVEWGHSCPLP